MMVKIPKKQKTLLKAVPVLGLTAAITACGGGGGGGDEGGTPPPPPPEQQVQILPTQLLLVDPTTNTVQAEGEVTTVRNTADTIKVKLLLLSADSELITTIDDVNQFSVTLSISGGATINGVASTVDVQLVNGMAEVEIGSALYQKLTLTVSSYDPNLGALTTVGQYAIEYALMGTEGDDVERADDPRMMPVTGTALDDAIYGLGGNDDLLGLAGNDTLYGGEGEDRLYAHEGDDTLYGEGGNDSLEGFEGNDTLDGGLGDDRLEGGEGDNVLFGGEGNDELFGYDRSAPNGVSALELGHNVLNGQQGDDVLVSVVDTLNDLDLNSLAGSHSVLIGGQGNDSLLPGAGSNTIIYRKGDGLDSVLAEVDRGGRYEMDYISGDSAYIATGETDAVVFCPQISISDVVLTVNENIFGFNIVEPGEDLFVDGGVPDIKQGLQFNTWYTLGISSQGIYRFLDGQAFDQYVYRPGTYIFAHDEAALTKLEQLGYQAIDPAVDNVTVYTLQELMALKPTYVNAGVHHEVESERKVFDVNHPSYYVGNYRYLSSTAGMTNGSDGLDIYDLGYMSIDLSPGADIYMVSGNKEVIDLSISWFAIPDEADLSLYTLADDYLVLGRDVEVIGKQTVSEPVKYLKFELQILDKAGEFTLFYSDSDQYTQAQLLPGYVVHAYTDEAYDYIFKNGLSAVHTDVPLLDDVLTQTILDNIEIIPYATFIAGVPDVIEE